MYDSIILEISFEIGAHEFPTPISLQDSIIFQIDSLHIL